MHHQTPRPARPRLLALPAAAAILLAATIAACGSSAPASTTPGQSTGAQPSVALPSVALPSVALPSVALPSVGTGSAKPGVDAAAGLKIAAPYTLTALPGALQQTFETQMAAGLGAFGNSISVGFRQVGGGNSLLSILMVVGFPSGTLSETGYQAALTGMGSSMGATFKTTTVDGVAVSSGTMSTTGGVAIFHQGDHMLIVISQDDSETLAIAGALISANK